MKKLLSISIIAFMLFGLASCYSKKTLTSQEQYDDYRHNKKGEYKADEKKMVMKVVTKLNDTIIFSKKNPGSISEKEIFGFPQVAFPINKIDSTIFNQNTIQYIWKEGKKYKFISQNKSGYVCRLDMVNIPFEDIAQMEVRNFDKKKTAGTVVLSVTVSLTVAFLTVAVLFLSSGM